MTINSDKSWHELSFRAKVAVLTAIFAFIAGFGMVYLSFLTPPLGEMTDEALYVLGQSLIYSGSILGLTNYFSLETKRLRKELFEFVEEQKNDRSNEKES